MRLMSTCAENRIQQFSELIVETCNRIERSGRLRRKSTKKKSTKHHASGENCHASRNAKTLIEFWCVKRARRIYIDEC
jgi:hypothetical protein